MGQLYLTHNLSYCTNVVQMLKQVKLAYEPGKKEQFNRGVRTRRIEYARLGIDGRGRFWE